MRRSTRSGLLACAWLTVALAGCGGGGSGGYSSSTPPPPAPAPAPSAPTSAEGVYQGTLSGSASSAFQMLVLETGEYWLLYGSITNNAFVGAGFVRGTGSTSAAPTGVAFISSDALDFATTPPVAGSLSAVYNGTSLDGTLSGSGGAVTFNGALLTTGNYSYAGAPSLSDLAGTWQLNNNSLAMQVDASGAFTVTQGGCTVNGSFVPRPSGKNVFDVTMTIGAAPCSDPGGARTGIAITYPTGGGQQQLIVLSTDTANPPTTGSAWAGTH